jgi:hypothetical protein
MSAAHGRDNRCVRKLFDRMALMGHPEIDRQGTQATMSTSCVRCAYMMI